MLHTVNCTNCNIVFSVSNQRFLKNKQLFCSNKCLGIYNTIICKTKILVKCHNCQKELKLKKSRIKRLKTNQISCSRKCSNTLKQKIYSGRKNPNCQYHTIDDNFFKIINTEEKAYLLGWIASDGHISPTGAISISIHQKDLEVLQKLRNIICVDLPIKQRKDTMVSLTINSKTMMKDICQWLKIKPGNKCITVDMPILNNDKFTWAFIRGYFDGDGNVKSPIKKETYLGVTIASQSMLIKQSFQNFCDKYEIKSAISPEVILFSTKHGLRFLSMIYDNTKLCLKRKKYHYLLWIEKLKNKENYKDSINYANTVTNKNQILQNIS